MRTQSRFFKALSFIIGILSAGTLARAASNDLTGTLQKGLFEEEANHNLNGAIQAYQSVVSQFDKDRKLVATAIFRLGECYRKQGNTNGAAAQYDRVVREFSDQTQLVTLSRQNLLALGAAVPPEGGTLLPSAARQEQKRLLQEEIKLVENKLFSDQKRFESGVGTQEDLWATQRQILELKRKLVAIDAGQPEIVQLNVPSASSTASESEPAPSTSAEAQEIRHIQGIIKDSPDLINATDKQGETLLHKAAAEGRTQVAQFLLTNGANVEARNRQDRTPLLEAVYEGHRAMVELLLGHKANLEAVEGWIGKEPRGTALHIAAGRGFRNIAEVLLKHGANVNAQIQPSGRTPLLYAVLSFQQPIAELLLAAGADVNARDSSGVTPLYQAVFLNDKAMVELLLKHQAKVDEAANTGQTPLGLAAEHGDVAVATLLLSRGANVNAQNQIEQQRGWTPLVYAVTANRTEMVALLLTNQADPNVRFLGSSPGQNQEHFRSPTGQITGYHTVEGWTPLMSAAVISSGPNPEIMRLLLENKADPNLKADDGSTALILAEAFADSSLRARLAAVLLEHGADPKTRDASGNKTALHIAAEQGDEATAELLIQKGADVNARDAAGGTPLHLAVFYRHAKTTRLLLDHGADPNAEDNEGQTPILLAKGRVGPMNVSPAEVTALLREHGAVEDLPHFNQIQGRRPGGAPYVVLQQGTNTWNQFTALEVLALEYGFLARSPEGESGQRERNYLLAMNGIYPLPFPDFAHLRIHRPGTSLTNWEDQPLDFKSMLIAGDCSQDVSLKWGDVLEIPETDHPLNSRWAGFSRPELSTFANCLAREVTIIVKGKESKVRLAPDIESGMDSVGTKVPFWIKPVLRNSNLLLFSSDLAHVKVTRQDPGTGEKHEWVIDCSDNKPAPDLWLRDGDVIEVPEKQ